MLKENRVQIHQPTLHPSASSESSARRIAPLDGRARFRARARADQDELIIGSIRFKTFDLGGHETGASFLRSLRARELSTERHRIARSSAPVEGLLHNGRRRRLHGRRSGSPAFSRIEAGTRCAKRAALRFCVHCSDPAALPAMQYLLTCDELQNVPFLVLGNKIDGKKHARPPTRALTGCCSRARCSCRGFNARSAQRCFGGRSALRARLVRDVWKGQQGRARHECAADRGLHVLGHSQNGIRRRLPLARPILLSADWRRAGRRGCPLRRGSFLGNTGTIAVSHTVGLEWYQMPQFSNTQSLRAAVARGAVALSQPPGEVCMSAAFGHRRVREVHARAPAGGTGHRAASELTFRSAPTAFLSIARKPAARAQFGRIKGTGGGRETRAYEKTGYRRRASCYI